MIWKAFATFEEVEAHSETLFASLTPGQRLERFFAMLATRHELGIKPKPIDPKSFVLRKNVVNLNEILIIN
ncbi:MAG: hypothetical protein HY842_06290 [Bacteroidetes bacterium]|nr:hypothetical protein [Bacteroidota bacterium]